MDNMTKREANSQTVQEGREGWLLWCKSQRHQAEQRIKHATPRTVSAQMLMCEAVTDKYRTLYETGIESAKRDSGAGYKGE